MGSTQNKGIELALNAVLVDQRDYSLQFSFNIAMNRNKVLDLGGLDRIEAYSSWASTQIDYDFVVTPGQSLGQIWGYVSDGRVNPVIHCGGQQRNRQRKAGSKSPAFWYLCLSII